MISKPRFLLVFLAGALLEATPIFGQDVEKALNDQYREQILVLRHPVETSSQVYDSEGKLLSKSSLGSWAQDGRMLVKKIILSEDKLRVEGKREIYKVDERDGHLRSAHSGEGVKVIIRLDAPLASVDQASLVLARVFALTDDEKRHVIPSDWLPYVTDHTVDQSSAREAKGPGLPNEKVLNVSEGVTAPRLLHKQEPDFPPGIRNVHGRVGLNIVVDSTGHVRDVKIVHSLHKVLDEQAVDAVKHWRFRPATKDGVPVAVAVYVEIDFQLN